MEHSANIQMKASNESSRAGIWPRTSQGAERPAAYRSRRPFLRAQIAGFMALFIYVLTASSASAAPAFAISRTYLANDGRPRVEFTSREDSYYILYRGVSVVEIVLPKELQLGASGLMELADPSAPAGEPARFYRVLQVPKDNPRDTDSDGIDDVWELLRPGLLNPLNPADAATDPDGDGKSHLFDYLAATEPLTTIIASSPASGAGDVSVTRETVLWFSRPLAPGGVVNLNNFFATFSQQTLLSRVELSADRRKATLFYQENLPGSSLIRVHFNGDGLHDDLGRLLDADGDDQPGGTGIIEFNTLSQSSLAGTTVFGRVFASELALRNNGETNLSVNVPLEGVIISADGLEETVRAVTDQNGDFRLENCPSGPFFVHIDGRAITNLTAGVRYPDLNYYPYVGKKWVSVPGQETTVGEIYLPLVTAGTLQSVSPVEETLITFPAGVVDAFPELAGATLTVPPNALYSDNGIRGGKVGIAPVPPDRIPSPLPDGLDFALVITVQTDGALNFDAPVPVCFPNLAGLPPGSKSALWSFNHDTGDWEIVGPMTVSADGSLVCSDEGVGILAPGWHGDNPATANDGRDGAGAPGPNQNETPDLGTCDPNDNVVNGSEETEPVHLFSGEYYKDEVDMTIKGIGMDFVWRRFYRSRSEYVGPLGYGWDHGYNISIRTRTPGRLPLSGALDAAEKGIEAWVEYLRNEDPLTDLQVAETANHGIYFSDGRSNREDRFGYGYTTNGIWTSSGYPATIEIDPVTLEFTMYWADQSKWHFGPLLYDPANGEPPTAKIQSMEDRNGNTISFAYNDDGQLSEITDTRYQKFQIEYNDQGFVSRFIDHTARVVSYQYYGEDEAGGSPDDLKSVTSPIVTGTPNENNFPDGKTVTYTYTKDFDDDELNHNLRTIKDARGNTIIRNTYTATTDDHDFQYDRVARQQWGDGFVDLTYVETIPEAANYDTYVRTIVNDRMGNVSEYWYDYANQVRIYREHTGRADPALATTTTENRPGGRLRSDDPDYFETRYEYNDDYQLTRVIHPRGNYTEYVYQGDLLLAPADASDASAATRLNLRRVLRWEGELDDSGTGDYIEDVYDYKEGAGACCGTSYVTYHRDGNGNITTFDYDDFGNRIESRRQVDDDPANDIVDTFSYDTKGRLKNHVHPDNGSGSHRVDAFTYWSSGNNAGFLKERVIDDFNLELTTQYTPDARGNLISITDPRGNITDFTFNQLDQIVRVEFPETSAGSGIRYHQEFYYDENNNVVRTDTQNLKADGTEDSSNPILVTTIQYSTLNQPLRRAQEVAEGSYVVTEFLYDLNQNQVETRFGEAAAARQPGNIVRVEYDERDLPFQVTRGYGSANPSTVQLDYDANRNAKMRQDGLEDSPHLTEFVHDAWDRLLATQDAMGNVEWRFYDKNSNLTGLQTVGEIEDVPGSTANQLLRDLQFNFDALDRLTSRRERFFRLADSTPVDDGWSDTDIEYSDFSQVLKITNDNGHARANHYDSANRLERVVDAAGNERLFSYNENNSLINLHEIDQVDGGGTQEFDTGYQYDALERLIEVTDNRANATRYTYDSRHNRVTKTDALENVTRQAYDGLNRLIETTYQLTDTGLGSGVPDGEIINRQTWDDTSRLTAQIDGNDNATTYVYDDLNRLVSTVMADGTADAITYDVHDNRISHTDANGSTVTSTFDLLDRLVRKDVTIGGGAVATTTFETFGHDGLSRRVSAVNNAATVTFAYDSLGNTLAESLQFTGAAEIANTLCQYDGLGNLIRCDYPSGFYVENAFDELERKFQINDPDGLVAAYQFAGPGRVARRTYGNGVVSDYSWSGVSGGTDAIDNFGVKRISGITTTKDAGATILDQRSFAWDKVYNKTRHTDDRIGRTTDYQYDSIYRLTHSERIPALGSLGAVSYEYDAVGNRMTVVGGSSAGNYTLANTTPEPADRQVNQYTTSPQGGHGYDGNGNLRSTIGATLGDNREYQYDYANRMVAFLDPASGVTADYVYDALGRRIRKTVFGGSPEDRTFFYRGWTTVDEVDLLTGTTDSFVRGHYIDEILKTVRAAGDLYHTTDDLYSLSLLTDGGGGGGTPNQRLTYEDFGKPYVVDGGGSILSGALPSLPHNFTGRRFDSESELHHYRSRYLDTEMGRFLARDFIGTWGDSSDYGNGRAYVGGNPTSKLDPSGQQSGSYWDEAVKPSYDHALACGATFGEGALVVISGAVVTTGVSGTARGGPLIGVLAAKKIGETLGGVSLLVGSVVVVESGLISLGFESWRYVQGLPSGVQTWEPAQLDWLDSFPTGAQNTWEVGEQLDLNY